MKLVSVLIDYDNARAGSEKSSRDVYLNLSILVSSVSERIHSLIADSEEIACRLYGGWTSLDNQTTSQAGWLLSEVSKFRGRNGPLRTKMSLAMNVICRSDLSFVGTYRDGGQKMVDGMICTDLIHLASDDTQSLVLVSDDDDFVPSVIASATLRSTKRPVYVLRREKKIGKGPNDHILRSANVIIAEY